MSLEYLGKFPYRDCEVCGERTKGRFFIWHLPITKKEKDICNKCAIRQYGKKYTGYIYDTRDV